MPAEWSRPATGLLGPKCLLRRADCPNRTVFFRPKAEMRRVRTGRLVEAGLVDQPEITPAAVAIEFRAGMRAVGLQQVESAEGGRGHPVPEPVLAAGPNEPGVAARDFLRRRA